MSSDLFSLLSQHGIKTIQSEVAKNIDEAKSIAKKIGYPVVLKISTDQPVHKTELGLVKIGIDAINIDRAFKDIIEKAKDAKVEYDGVIIQEMAEPGLETIVGIKQDAQFGTVIMFGIGGIYTEILHDFSLRICPITETDATEMIEDLKSKDMLSARGRRYSKDAIAKLLMAVNDLAMKENIKELDLNPVILYPQGSSKQDYVVVDVRIVK
jgi:succinyl-CoA synthetase beta subunit